MNVANDYQLLDFGDGRKLERFGDFVLDRPAPAAEGIERGKPELWHTANGRYERTSGERGIWLPEGALPESWIVRFGSFAFELKPTEFGHLGIFPEQADNWEWIAEQVRNADRPLKVLNLFAYTGGSTLAAATACSAPGSAGGLVVVSEVVHVDAAKNTVAWARKNAEHSGLANATIRWICEDATKFVRRELKRGNHYDAVILDPPSFGRGPAGEMWKIEEHLPDLLRDCVALTAGQPQFMLLTAHTTGVGKVELRKLLADALGPEKDRHVISSEMNLIDSQERKLPCGVMARWSALAVA